MTIKFAEEVSDYLERMGVKAHYLHSEIDTLERTEIIKALRLGIIDVIVGINLLREGLDIPEVSLVAIFDADKQGFLRNEVAFADNWESIKKLKWICYSLWRFGLTGNGVSDKTDRQEEEASK